MSIETSDRAVRPSARLKSGELSCHPDPEIRAIGELINRLHQLANLLDSDVSLKKRPRFKSLLRAQIEALSVELGWPDAGVADMLSA